MAGGGLNEHHAAAADEPRKAQGQIVVAFPGGSRLSGRALGQRFVPTTRVTAVELPPEGSSPGFRVAIRTANFIGLIGPLSRRTSSPALLNVGSTKLLSHLPESRLLLRYGQTRRLGSFSLESVTFGGSLGRLIDSHLGFGASRHREISTKILASLDRL